MVYTGRKPIQGDMKMNKLISLTCGALLLTTSLHSMHTHPSFYRAIKLNDILRQFKPISPDKLNLIPKLCPDVVNTALALALYQNSKDIIPFVLMHEQSNPNYIIHPEIIALIKDSSNALINQSERARFFKLKDQTTANQPEGIPTFYFAQDEESANECGKYGVDLGLEYTLRTEYGIKHGNILTYISDNKDYVTNLIQYYHAKGAGAYVQSYASEGGNALHHIVYVLNTANDQEARRLYKCASPLVRADPNLLSDRNRYGKTPGDCLAANIHNKDPKDTITLEALAQLFEEYHPSANVNKSSRE